MSSVVWLTSTYPWLGDTIAGSFFGTQARALARAGSRVTVVAPVPAAPWPLDRMSGRWRDYARTPREGQDGGVEVVRPRYLNVPGQPSWAMPDRFIADAAWRTRTRWREARLIHGHYSIIGLAAWRLARRTRLPFALTFHGSDLNTWPDEFPERRDDLRQAMRDASAVFTVSRALADRVRTLSGVEAVVLPIGCDHQAIAAVTLPRADARRRLGLPEDRLVALFVGRLVKEKGVGEFVAAIRSLGEPYLGVLVGSGPEANQVTGDPSSAEPLSYAGARDHDDVVRYMAAADVLVLPSYREGLPTVLVEAGSVGLPVIASNVGGIPDLLADGRGTVLGEVTPESVAGALRDFAASREAAQAAAARLHAYVMAEYDVDRNARRLLEYYRSISG